MVGGKKREQEKGGKSLRKREMTICVLCINIHYSTWHWCGVDGNKSSLARDCASSPLRLRINTNTTSINVNKLVLLLWSCDPASHSVELGGIITHSREGWGGFVA